MAREGERRRRTEFTIFVENLSKNVDSFALGRLFNKFGEISDVYIPNKSGRNSHKRFGFVRFRSERHGHDAIRNLNGYIFRNSRLNVRWARFRKVQKRRFNPQTKPIRRRATNATDHYYYSRRRSGFSSNQHTNGRGRHSSGKWVWRPKKVQPIVESPDSISSNLNCGKDKSIKEVHGTVCEENLEWLSKSIVCISNNPLDPDDMVSFLKSQIPSISRITDMGKYMVVLSFDSIEEANRALIEKKALWDNWFVEVRFWKDTDVCRTRRTWIELFGLPPLGWKPENISKIAEFWGEVVCLNEETVGVKSLEAACVLIDTPHLSFIDDEVIFHLQNKTFKVKVMESRITVNTFSSAEHGESNEENTLSDVHLNHGAPYKDRDELEIENSVADNPDNDDQNQDKGSVGADHSSSSRTWSDVLMGRNHPMASRPHQEASNAILDNQSERPFNAEQADIAAEGLDKQLEDDLIAKEARETLEFSKIIGIRPEEGYEEAFLKRTEKNIRRIKEGRASSKNQVGGF